MENWDLTKLFKTEEDFLKEIGSINELTDKMAFYQGKLNDESNLKNYLDLSYKMEEKLSKAFMYASLKASLNAKDVNNLKDINIARTAFNNLITKTSFEEPEMLSLGKDFVFKVLDSEEKYHQFKFAYEKLFRRQEHVLDHNSENIISKYNLLSSQGQNLYTALSNADKIDKEITLSNNKKVTVSQGNWRNLVMEAETAEDRKDIFEAIFSYYGEFKNTFAEIYKTINLSELAYTQVKKYHSILESHLFNNNIPEKVFLTLIDVVSTNTDIVKKYYKLRKDYLKLDEHYSYDRFLSLAKVNKKYTYQEAKEYFFKSIEKFPLDFQNKAKEALEDGYVDVYEKPGKRSGAFSSGGENNHPYILLNFDGSLDDIFTVAHEAGHSIHTLYSIESQPLLLQSYTIFVAEIASTFNEHNLLDYLFSSGKLDRNEEIFLLQKSIDEIISTFYRQTLFAQFEYEVSKLVETYQPINHEVLSNIMIKLYDQYYGLDITKEKYKQFVWAYIPHLYNSPFYVYQYATSFSASMKIYEDVKNNVPHAFEDYIKMLKSAGSDYPINQVKLANVDLEQKDAYLGVIRRLEELVTRLEKLLK